MDKGTIVIVDDEQAVLDMLKTAFDFEGVEIVSFLSPLQGIEYVKNNKVEVLITDIMMPEMNGIKLIEELKELDPFIQIIAITGFPSLEKKFRTLSIRC